MTYLEKVGRIVTLIRLLSVPDDFDQMGQDEIEQLFGGGL